jgi:hypothetical protein
MIKPNKHKILINAWADGAEIQRYQPVDDRWVICENPTWRPDMVYRVKPVPKPDLVMGVQAYITRETLLRVTPFGECSNLRLKFDMETGELKSADVL